MIIVERKSHGFREVILGRCGENNVLQIRINIQSLIDTYGDGNAVLVHKRSQDTIPYLVPIERDGNEIVWTVTSVDTNYPGVGECEIRWLVGDAIAKSIIYKTIVRPSLTGESTPEPPDSWYDRMIAYLNDHTVTNVAVNYLPSGSEPTVEYEDGLVTFGIPAGAKGEKGDKGDKGDTGATGAKGDKGDTGAQGIPGIQGEKGEQGIQGEKGEKGDKGDTGAKGEKGDKGDQGEQGIQGPKGDPGEVSEAELTAKLMDKADVIVDTASGAIASFPDGAAVAAKDVTIGIEPVQSGSGDPSPTNVRPISGWTGANVTRTGKNLFDPQKVIDAGGTFDGTKYNATQGILQNMSLSYIKFAPNEQYYFYAIGKIDSSNTCGAMRVKITYTDATVELKTILSADAEAAHDVYSNANKSIATIEFSPYGTLRTNKNYFKEFLICKASYGTKYEPYQGTTYPISWQSEAGTVYGGTLDVTTGLLTVTMAEVDLGTLTWKTHAYIGTYRHYAVVSGMKSPGETQSEWINGIICSKYVPDVSVIGGTPKEGGMARYGSPAKIYIIDGSFTDDASFKAAMSGVQLVYELATPQTYQLTPTEVTLLLGENNVWADTGDSTVTYRADTKLYIQKINTPSDDDMIADAQIASGKYFIIGGNLYRSTTTIPAGDTITPGTNCILTDLAEALNALNT